MRMPIRIVPLAGLLAVLVAGQASATIGYIPIGHSTQSRGMGGVGAAVSDGAITAADNPAGMAFVGNRVDAGLELFSPHRRYTVSGTPGGGPVSPGLPPFPLNPGEVGSNREGFLIPHFGWNRQLDARRTVGVSVYAHGGINTSYPAFPNPTCPPGTSGTGSFCAGATGVDLMQLFVSPTYAHRFDDAWAVGISPVIAYQRFRAKGIQSLAGFSADPQNLSDNGTDEAFGYGGHVGLRGELAPGLDIGLAYRSEVRMEEFDEYAGLFADDGNFDIPASANAGLAWHATGRTLIGFDVQYIWYSDVQPVGNPFLPNALTGARLGDDGGPGFGWNDMTVYKLGVETGGGPWTLRAGVTYGEQPIPREEVLFNILAPGVQEWHFTGGFTRRLGSGNELSFAAMYSPRAEQEGTNPLDSNQTIELEMYQWAVELSWAWHY